MPGAAVAAPGLSAGAFRETLAAGGIIPHPTAEEEPLPPLLLLLLGGRRVTQPYVDHHSGMTPAWRQWQADAAFAIGLPGVSRQQQAKAQPRCGWQLNHTTIFTL